RGVEVLAVRPPAADAAAARDPRDPVVVDVDAVRRAARGRAPDGGRDGRRVRERVGRVAHVRRRDRGRLSRVARAARLDAADRPDEPAAVQARGRVALRDLLEPDDLRVPRVLEVDDEQALVADVAAHEDELAGAVDGLVLALPELRPSGAG